MDFSQISSDIIVIIIGFVIYLAKSYLAKKNADLEKNLESVEKIVQLGIAKAAAIKTEGVPKETLLDLATNVVITEIENSKAVKKTVTKLGIDVSKESVQNYIELALHASKLGINNVLKSKLKNVVK